LHEGVQEMIDIHLFFNSLLENTGITVRIPFVLSGFMNKLAAHFERFHLIHSKAMNPRAIVQPALPACP
jgi:hypothetical protein